MSGCWCLSISHGATRLRSPDRLHKEKHTEGCASAYLVTDDVWCMCCSVRNSRSRSRRRRQTWPQLQSLQLQARTKSAQYIRRSMICRASQSRRAPSPACYRSRPCTGRRPQTKARPRKVRCPHFLLRLSGVLRQLHTQAEMVCETLAHPPSLQAASTPRRERGGSIVAVVVQCICSGGERQRKTEGLL